MVNISEGLIDIEVMPIFSALKDPKDRVFKEAAIPGFNRCELEECFDTGANVFEMAVNTRGVVSRFGLPRSSTHFSEPSAIRKRYSRR